MNGARSLLMVVAVCLLASKAGWTAEDLGQTLKYRRLFEAARSDLLRHGWSPVEPVDTWPDGTPVNQHVQTLPFYEAGIVEVAACSQGAVYCNFYYRRKTECLLIITVGEYIPGKSPILFGWQHRCYVPEPPQE